MQFDYVCIGKGPSASAFNWDRLLEPYPLVAINEAVTLVPPQYPATVTCFIQDWDPIRRLLAAKFPVPTAIWIPGEHVETAKNARLDLPWHGFRLCDVPRGATALIAMHFMRRWTDGNHRLRVGCIGFDAYFGGGATYADAFSKTLKEPISRAGDYGVVNTQIRKFAEHLKVDLIDLPAEVGA